MPHFRGQPHAELLSGHRPGSTALNCSTMTGLHPRTGAVKVLEGPAFQPAGTAAASSCRRPDNLFACTPLTAQEKEKQAEHLSRVTRTLKEANLSTEGVEVR